MSDTATRLIQQLALQAHPEGGWYRQTYRSEERITRANGEQRRASTAIVYLLRDTEYSAWHRIDADELWHHHAGDALHIHVLSPTGELSRLHLGHPLNHAGASFQHCVHAGSWFAAERAGDEHGYALSGCTVAPGFEFAHFELADVMALRQQFPQAAEVLERLRSTQSGCPGFVDHYKAGEKTT